MFSGLCLIVPVHQTVRYSFSKYNQKYQDNTFNSKYIEANQTTWVWYQLTICTSSCGTKAFFQTHLIYIDFQFVRFIMLDDSSLDFISVFAQCGDMRRLQESLMRTQNCDQWIHSAVLYPWIMAPPLQDLQHMLGIQPCH